MELHTTRSRFGPKHVLPYVAVLAPALSQGRQLVALAALVSLLYTHPHAQTHTHTQTRSTVQDGVQDSPRRKAQITTRKRNITWDAL